MKVIKRCKKCERYMTCDEIATIHKAFNCNGILEQINIPCDDMYIIEDISTDKEFLQAMIDLKESDPIEYQLKLSQFKTQLEQKRQANQQEKNQVRCPKCGSTSITTGARGVNLTWGFIGASKTVNRCADCGHTWKP